MGVTAWPIVVFATKLLLVGAVALLIAVSLWALDHALRHGVVFETKPGPVRTRSEAPLRYWLYIAGQLLFVAAASVMIHFFINVGEPSERPAANTREEQPAPARPSDESYDRAGADSLVLASASAPKPRTPTIVGPDTVRLIESKVVMPRTAKPLVAYDRFYMLRTIRNQDGRLRDVVEGRFMLREPDRAHFREGAVAVPGVPNAFTIKRGGRLPDVADGGCTVVTIFFDLATRAPIGIVEQYEGAKPEPAVCNGYD